MDSLLTDDLMSYLKGLPYSAKYLSKHWSCLKDIILKAAHEHIDSVRIPSTEKYKPKERQCYIALKTLNRIGFKLKSSLINNGLWPRNNDWTDIKLSLEELEL